MIGYHGRMKIYLVGGAVRDQLLGRPLSERDWVVVGAHIEDLLAQGYLPVGKEFPVFLHPRTKEEYALARTEKKVSKGYKGFTFYTDPNVTLEQDLLRRDLTINAMAQDTTGEIIDPYGGQTDLKAHCLRHVSPAFAEDPVRILRLARFNAALPHFHIHPSTQVLVKKMVRTGEVNALVPERVFAECDKALSSTTPWLFFDVLFELNVLTVVMPELLWTAEAQQILKRLSKTSDQPMLRFSASLSHLPLEKAQRLCSRLKVPTTYRELTQLIIQAQSFLKIRSLNAKGQLDFLLMLDALRRPERFKQVLLLLKACQPEFNDSDRLSTALTQIRQVDVKPLIEQGLTGEALKQALYNKRLLAIGEV